MMFLHTQADKKWLHHASWLLEMSITGTLVLLFSSIVHVHICFCRYTQSIVHCGQSLSQTGKKQLKCQLMNPLQASGRVRFRFVCLVVEAGFSINW